MKSITWLAVAVVATVALGTANAHPHAYAVGNDFLSITETEDTDGVPDIGGVRFAVGEIQILDPLLNNAVLTLSDDVLNPVGGSWCQDWNDNSICGESDPVTGADLEPFAFFCGAIEIVSGGTPNWDQGFESLIFLDGPVFGSPVFSTCGNVLDGTGTAQSNGITGTADHS